MDALIIACMILAFALGSLLYFKIFNHHDHVEDSVSTE